MSKHTKMFTGIKEALKIPISKTNIHTLAVKRHKIAKKNFSELVSCTKFSPRVILKFRR